MNDNPNNNIHTNQHDQRSWEQVLRDLDRAALQRAAADNEPGAEDALAALEGDREQDHRTIQNETALRHAVGRVLGSQTAPEQLRARVLASLADESDGASIPFSQVESKTAHKTQTGFTGVLARIGRPLAAAAVLGVGAIAAYQAVYNANPSGGQTASVLPTGQIQELTQYLSGRHKGALEGTYESAQVTSQEALLSIESAVGQLTPTLRESVSTLASAGYQLRVVKVCQVPNAVTSAHITLTPPADAAQSEAVSVFIQTHGTDANSCLIKRLNTGNCYICPEAKAAGDQFALWREGSFVLHVLSHSEPSFEQLMRVLQPPTARVDLQ